MYPLRTFIASSRISFDIRELDLKESAFDTLYEPYFETSSRLASGLMTIFSISQLFATKVDTKNESIPHSPITN